MIFDPPERSRPKAFWQVKGHTWKYCVVREEPGIHNLISLNVPGCYYSVVAMTLVHDYNYKLFFFVMFSRVQCYQDYQW